ncbi:hypothetical protein CONLIGDRAFT_84464 [Coniochaeta ligniaria NRRL 30616]|uniref:Clr5 domain-containing protein n=1 Tax=Coniochaeta ligniaria NRRL 30616 TaxID=1408157 RepID=A0A1J7JC73_9PEZI|nr:hypothetical protein CONLIGDRAFT_84464 [Coniochaeta ligniaria NRRL 30616]
MTKKWEEHKATIISFYKEQHKPLHEVKRLMEEQYGFEASVRAYRSRFDRWGVYKYNCRRPGGSTTDESGGDSPASDRSHFSPKREEPDSPLLAVTPPSTPHDDQTTPLAGEQARGQQLTLQPVAAMSPQHRYFPDSAGGSGGGGGCLVPPSPGSAESITSDSTMSRTSSVSYPYNSDSGSLVHGSHHHRHSFSTSPTEHQYTQFDMYRQHSYPQQYQGSHQYHPHLNGAVATGCLAPPPGLAVQHDQTYVWSVSSPQAPPYHVSSDDIKAPRE